MAILRAGFETPGRLPVCWFAARPRPVFRAAECHPDLRNCLPTILTIALILLLGARNVGAQVTREYDLKAAFLFNFAQFVEWPASAFTSADEPFTIGVLGEDPFGAALDDVVRNEKVNGRRLLVRRYRKVEEIKGCQILFIGKSESTNAWPILSALRGRHVLTVGEADDPGAQTGIIQFLTEKNRIRLRIDLDQAKKEELTISSKLLRAAEIVNRARAQ